MKNGYKIVWMDEALQNLSSIIESRWTEKEVRKFSSRLDYVLNHISKRPHLYPESIKFKGIRKAVIIKPVVLYYRVLTNHVELLTLFDTRQNPKKLNL